MKPKALTKSQDKLEFTSDQITLIKQTIAVGATDQELQLFLYQAKRTGLDPLARQVYFIKRQGKGTIQTSIDGFRVVAERSKVYAGQDEPVFEEDGSKFPKKCTVKVYRWHGEQRYPAGVGVAYWSEYKPAAGQDFMWNKMPHTMLSKVAEALALRKAFPQDLSGIYTDEEMAQTQEPKDTKQPEQAEDGEVIENALETPQEAQETLEPSKQVQEYPMSRKQQGMIFALLTEKGYSKKHLDVYLQKKFSKDSLTKLTVQEATTVIKKIKSLKPKTDEATIEVDPETEELNNEVELGMKQERKTPSFNMK